MTIKSRVHSIRRVSICLLAAAITGSTFLVASATAAPRPSLTAPYSWSTIALLSPWHSAQTAFGLGTPRATIDAHGVVHLEGAASGGTSSTNVAILPAQFRPSKLVYFPIATDNGDSGELFIKPDGTMTVYGSPIAYASLAGLSYASMSSTVSATPLTMQNGWVSENPIYSTGIPRVSATATGIVSLTGSLGGGTASTQAFRLPAPYRPANEILVPVYSYGGLDTSYLDIKPSGAVLPVGTLVSTFTSLAGVTFVSATSTLTMKTFTLQGTWMPSHTPKGGVDAHGTVHLEGSLQSGTSAEMFVLPPSLRPGHTIFEATGGNISESMISITPAGVVSTYGANAQSFTDVSGITFQAAGS